MALFSTNYHWDVLDQPVNNFCPRHLIGSTNFHITELAYSNRSELLVSYNDEHWYTCFRKTWALNRSQIMAANRRGREVQARITLSPDVVMHVLTLQRRQALVYREASPTEADSDSDSTPEKGSPADPTECLPSGFVLML